MARGAKTNRDMMSSAAAGASASSSSRFTGRNETISEADWDNAFDDEWANQNGILEDTELLKVLLEHAAAFRYTRVMNSVQEILLSRGESGKLPANSLSARYFCIATVEKALTCYRYNHSLQVVADFLKCGLTGISDQVDDILDDIILEVRQQQCLEHLVFQTKSATQLRDAPDNEFLSGDPTASITCSQIKRFYNALEEYFPWENLDQEYLEDEEMKKYMRCREPLIKLYEKLTLSRHWEEFSHSSAPIHPPRNWRKSIEEWHIARQHWQKNALDAIQECCERVMSYEKFKQKVFRFLSDTYNALPEPQLLKMWRKSTASTKPTFVGCAPEPFEACKEVSEMLTWDSKVSDTQISGNDRRNEEKSSVDQVTSSDLRRVYDEATMKQASEVPKSGGIIAPSVVRHKKSNTQNSPASSETTQSEQQPKQKASTATTVNEELMEQLQNAYSANTLAEAGQLYASNHPSQHTEDSEGRKEGPYTRTNGRATTATKRAAQDTSLPNQRPQKNKRSDNQVVDDTDSDDELTGLTDNKPVLRDTSNGQLQRHQQEVNEFAHIGGPSQTQSPARTRGQPREYATQPSGAISQDKSLGVEGNGNRGSMMETQENAEELEFESEISEDSEKGVVAMARKQITKTNQQFASNHVSPLHKGASAKQQTGQKSGGRKAWTKEETVRFLEGVKKYGVGEWSAISSGPMQSTRTNMQLKDRFRVLVRQGKIDDDGNLLEEL